MNSDGSFKPMESNVLLQTPITYNMSWMSTFSGKRCELFEQKWLDCASKLGLTRASRDCQAARDDLKECTKMDVAYKRYLRMQEERQKRQLPYQDPPPVDTLQYNRFKNIVH